jgi:hypothetical protein
MSTYNYGKMIAGGQQYSPMEEKQVCEVPALATLISTKLSRVHFADST